MNTNYLVIGCKSWNREVYDDSISKLPGSWHYTDDRKSLNSDFIARINPRYIFFLHWSYKVPAVITDCYECVCFHMTDVPFGRGGSPLQNLIIRKYKTTKLTALRMTDEMDAGPFTIKKVS